LADPVKDGLLREIDEEIRQERYQELWKRYGSWVIAAAVALVVVVVVAGYQFWQGYQRDSRAEAGERFAQALSLRESDAQAAERAFAALADDGSGGHALLARFQQAALIARRGDHAGAAEAYGQLAADAGDANLRSLAQVLYVLHALAGRGGADPADLRQRLQPLAEEGNAWRFAAREMLAVIDLQSGDVAAARDRLTELAADLVAPAATRARAQELLAALDGQ